MPEDFYDFDDPERITQHDLNVAIFILIACALLLISAFGVVFLLAVSALF